MILPDPPASPIFSMLTTDPRGLARFCQQQGFMVRPVVYPTVPKGTDRVRVCLHSGNSNEEIEQFLSTVTEWLNAEGIRANHDPSTRARL